MLVFVDAPIPQAYAPLCRPSPHLPRPERKDVVGCVVACENLLAVEQTLAWRRAASKDRHVPELVVILPRDFDALRRLARDWRTEILFTDELDEGGVPAWVIEDVLLGGLLDYLSRAVVAKWGIVPANDQEEMKFKLLLAAGAAGRSVGTAARFLDVSESRLRRGFTRKGLPSPGSLLRSLQAEAVEFFVDAGMPYEEAVRLCGWADTRSAALDLRRRGTSVIPTIPRVT